MRKSLRLASAGLMHGRSKAGKVRLASTALAVVAATLLSGCAIGFRGPALNVTSSSAVLTGGVLSDRSEAGNYWFRYAAGRPSRFGDVTPPQPITFQRGVQRSVSEPISGLEHHTTYYYALCAEDQDPSVDALCSADSTFTTGGDHIRGQLLVLTSPLQLATATFNDVRSGSAGENPLGSVTLSTMPGNDPVTCLRIAGQKATAGYEQFGGALYGFIFVDLTPGVGKAATEVAGSTRPTTCPADPSPTTPLLPAQAGTGFEIHDEP